MAKSPQELFQEREKRIQDVTELKVPDRIPVAPLDSGWFVKYSGISWQQAFYDIEKLITAKRKMVLETDLDCFLAPMVFTPGSAYDLLDMKQVRWAGAKIAESMVDPKDVFQFVEPGTGYETMPAEDYDLFLDDPSDYIIRRHWPRIMGAMSPLRNLPPLHTLIAYGYGIPDFNVFGTPEIAGALEALTEAGKKQVSHNNTIAHFIEEMVAAGYPPGALAVSMAPFDYFADYLRGTRGCMIDMYRRPDKLKEAIDRVTPWIIDMTLNIARPAKDLCKRVFIAIHKASGGFMSEPQHREFFWPSLRAVLLALIDEGLVPYVYTEGIYTERLEALRDVPKGKVIYHIESDLFKAKEILGDVACIEGGPSGPMLNFGTPQEVRDYCKKLIDICGKGGGFMMGSELPLLTARTENVQAMIDFTKEYGVYK
jgi:uroporphyrinogen-III decarboxylase